VKQLVIIAVAAQTVWLGGCSVVDLDTIGRFSGEPVAALLVAPTATCVGDGIADALREGARSRVAGPVRTTEIADSLGIDMSLTSFIGARELRQLRDAGWDAYVVGGLDITNEGGCRWSARAHVFSTGTGEQEVGSFWCQWQYEGRGAVLGRHASPDDCRAFYAVGRQLGDALAPRLR
jgi:hypothetical protein